MIDISKMQGATVLLVGDVMLDQYVVGAVHRQSPEAPVPVLQEEATTNILGGAANVALNMAAMGGDVTLIGVVGDDAQGRLITQELQDAGVTAHLVVDASRPTTLKTRFLNGDTHLMRRDWESTAPITGTVLDAVVAHMADTNHQAIVLSDYAKGVVQDAVIARAMAADAKVVIDPKGQDYSRYRGASMITPNRAELALVYPNLDEGAGAQALCADHAIDAVLLTRSEDGVSLFQDGQAGIHFPAQATQVSEVSGAGDSVIAAAALALAAGLGMPQAAELGNIAGSRAVEKSGTAIVTAKDLS